MIKQCWITRNGPLVSISIESENPHIPICVRQILFPVNVKKDEKQRHTTNIGLFDEEDINTLAQLLDNYRTDK